MQLHFNLQNLHQPEEGKSVLGKSLHLALPSCVTDPLVHACPGCKEIVEYGNSKMCKIIIQDKSAANMPPEHSPRTCKICGSVLCDKSFTF